MQHMAEAKRELKECQKEEGGVPLCAEDDERMRRGNWLQKG